MTLIAGIAATLAVLWTLRMAAARRAERGFRIVETSSHRGSGSLPVLLAAAVSLMALVAGYRWLPSGQQLTQIQLNPPQLRLAESFDSYRQLNQQPH